MTCQDCKCYKDKHCIFAGGVTADCEINLCCDNLFTPKDALPIIDTNQYEFAEIMESVD